MKTMKKTCEVAMHFNKTPNTFSDFTFQCIDQILTSSNQDTNIGATHIRVWIYKCASIFFLGEIFFSARVVFFFCCFFTRDFFSLARLFFFWRDWFFFFFQAQLFFFVFWPDFFSSVRFRILFWRDFFPFVIRFQIYCGLKQVRLSKKRATRWLPKTTQVGILLRS